MHDRAILRLAVPALGSLAIEPLYVLVDTAIVGHLGTAPLGGLALASVVLTTGFWAFNFLAYGTTARVAFLTGRGDVRGACGVAAQALWLALGLGVAVAIVLAVFGGMLARALDALAIAAQTLVATALGRADAAEARAVGSRIIVLSAAAGALLCVGALAAAPVLPAVFTGIPRVRSVATIGVIAVGLTQIPAAAVFALDGILIGAADFRFLKWGTIAGLTAFAPFALLVLANPRLGIAGIWAGLGAWIVARLAVNGARFAGRRWTLQAT